MCGIAGTVGELDTHLLRLMMAALAHRGPDGGGFDVYDPVQLAACRLSIVDVTGGSQPIYDETRQRCIVFNGEIYNHIALRRDLKMRGHTFRTRSDAEVVLHLYEERGPACLDDLDGMYALAIRDGQSLWLARDRLGIKPLYHTVADQTFLFASEIKGLLCSTAVRASLDTQALADRVALGYVPEPRTFLQGIDSLPAGHWMRVELNRDRLEIESRRYDDGPKEPCSDADLVASVDTLEGLMLATVASQARADVPVVIALSGGLDSSLIAHWLHKCDRHDVGAFVTVDARAHPDLRAAEDVSRQCGLQLVSEIPTFDEYLSAIPEFVLTEEQPATLDGMPIYLLLKRIGASAKVCLTGEGADELFGGYPAYISRRPTHRETKMRLLRLAATGLTPSDSAQQILERLTAATTFDDYLRETFRTNLRDALVRQHLELLDKYGMSAGVECRVPYLARDVVDFVTALPLQLKVETALGIQKYVLKRLALEKGGRSLIDPAIRPKLGLPSTGLHHETRFAALCERHLPDDYLTRHPLGPLFLAKSELLMFELFNEAFLKGRGSLADGLDVVDFMRSRGAASSMV